MRLGQNCHCTYAYNYVMADLVSGHANTHELHHTACNDVSLVSNGAHARNVPTFNCAGVGHGNKVKLCLRCSCKSSPLDYLSANKYVHVHM